MITKRFLTNQNDEQEKPYLNQIIIKLAPQKEATSRKCHTLSRGLGHAVLIETTNLPKCSFSDKISVTKRCDK